MNKKLNCCKYCQTVYLTTRPRSKRGLCSSFCSSLFRTKQGTKKVNCLNCKKVFRKKNGEISKTVNHFCSRSCAASYNNSKNPKRTLQGKCISCSTSVSSKRKYCNSCLSDTLIPKDLTLEEAQNRYSKHHASSASALVRTRARKISPKSPCQSCGYSKHTEVCHIKPISSFPKSTLISIINSPSNLIRLCRNCHWEFDQGILELENPSPDPPDGPYIVILVFWVSCTGTSRSKIKNEKNNYNNY